MSKRDDLGRTIEEAIREGKANANVAGRLNKAAAINTGKEGSSEAVSSRQTVRITQDGRETWEESETTVSDARNDA